MVIRAHYYASLIYSYQALAFGFEAARTIGSAVIHLFKEIRSLSVWPLFIAGTESWADIHGQTVVRDLFEESINVTGFWCNNAAIRFLLTFWARPEHHGVGKWVQYARQYQQDVGPFLVF